MSIGNYSPHDCSVVQWMTASGRSRFQFGYDGHSCDLHTGMPRLGSFFSRETTKNDSSSSKSITLCTEHVHTSPFTVHPGISAKLPSDDETQGRFHQCRVQYATDQGPEPSLLQLLTSSPLRPLPSNLLFQPLSALLWRDHLELRSCYKIPHSYIRARVMVDLRQNPSMGGFTLYSSRLFLPPVHGWKSSIFRHRSLPRVITAEAAISALATLRSVA